MDDLNIFIISLGCSKNFVDTEVMAGELLQTGFGLTADLEDADIVLINTCAFIPPARDEACEAIEDMIAWKAEGDHRKIVVSGCLSEWDKKDGYYKDEYGDVDLWLQVDEIPVIAEKLKVLYDGTDRVFNKNSDKPCYLYDEKTPRLQLTLSHFAYLKIADGCNNHCSYCAIPGIRGKLRSRTVESVVAEAKNLLKNGVKELILIAQDTTDYGRDLSGRPDNIVELIKGLDEIEGDFWVRMLYTHPASFSDELIEVMKNSKHLLPYVDIPLQHISDDILKRMNRNTTKVKIEALLNKLRQSVPNIVIRTTFLLGFPGETAENVDELCDFVSKQRFDRIGVFPFFPEPSTPAGALDNDLSDEEVDKRCDRLMAIQSQISLEKNEFFIGKTIDVLIDSIDEEGRGYGRTYRDAPEIDNMVIIKSLENYTSGDIVSVEIIKVEEFDLIGKVIG